MSRISNVPVVLPKGVEVTMSDSSIAVKGSKGSLSLVLHHLVSVERNDENLKVSGKDDSRESGSMAGTFRSLINNMVVGVEEGFTKSLVVNGVGYRAAVGDGILTLQLGYSHDIKLAIPDDLEVKCIKPTEISISGIDKQKVGQFASEVRALRKPEPYKGKGVRYSDEVIRRKEGKKK